MTLIVCYDVKVLRGAPAHTAGVHGAQWGKLPYMNREQIGDHSSHIFSINALHLYFFSMNPLQTISETAKCDIAFRSEI